MATVSTGLATSFINFSRPGASGGGATVTDRDGKIKWAGHNLLTNSESFDASAWSKEYTTVDANVTAAPNGTSTADLLKNTTANAVHGTYFTLTGVDASIGLRLSCFVKKNTVRYVALGIWNANGTAECGAGFDLDTGTGAAGAVGAGYSASNPSITSVGSNWYLISVTVVTPVTTNYPTIINRSTSYSSGRISEVYTGSTSESTYLWGAHLYRSDMQMQLNPSMPAGMQSYYPTTPRNLLGYTEDFANAYWDKLNIANFGSGSISNAAIAPNGLQTADLIVPDTTNGPHVVYKSPTLSAPRTVFVYAKAAGYNYLVMYNNGNVTNAYIGASFNLATGGTPTVYTGAGAGTASCTASISSVGNGWYRCSITITNNGNVNTDFTVRFSVSSTGVPDAASGGAQTFAGDGVSGIYLWGAQLSDSASLDTYVPVYGAAVTSAAYYAPRLDFDPVTLAARGLLVEEQRTNVLTRSEDMAGKFTGLSNATITNGTGFATITDDATSGTHFVVAQSIFTADGVTRTWSVDVKQGTARYVALSHADILSATQNTYIFDTQTGAWTATTNDTSYVLSYFTPQNRGDGWWRIGFTSNLNSAGYVNFLLGISNGPNFADRSYSGTGKTILVRMPQIEAGSFPTSYIPTPASATATRAADVASVSTQAFPYSASEGTIVVNATSALLPSAYTNGRAASLNDGTANNVIELYISQNAAVAVNAAGRVMVSGVQQTNPSKAITNNANPHKVAFAYKASDFAVTGDGLAPATETSGSLPTSITQMQLGALASTNYLNGHIRQITYLPRRISNAELQSRTA